MKAEMKNETQPDVTAPKVQITARKCSYDPVPDLQMLPQGDQMIAYLGVKHRVLWFQLYCAEKGLDGYIDDSNVVYDQTTGMFMATAVVYINDKVVGKSVSARVFDPSNLASSANALLGAATSAKGRALANAGFGTVNGQLEEGDQLPCDSGIPVTKEGIVCSPNNPMLVQVKDLADDNKAAKAKKTQNKAATQESQPAADATETPRPAEPAPEPPAVKMTLAEAKAYVVPLGNSQTKGKTLGEILAIDRNIVKFYGSEQFQNAKYPELKIAARIICEETNIA